MKQFDAQKLLRSIMNKNVPIKSLIGKGYHGTITPAPLRRNVIENPRWYTPYSPYQAEISQGRLETLFYFQKMVTEMTSLPISNASLLDLGSTAAEVVSISSAHHKDKRNIFFASITMHPYLLDILETKCGAMNIRLCVDKPGNFQVNDSVIGHMYQYPDTYGNIAIPRDLLEESKKQGIVLSAATDLMALTKFKPPGEFGMDIAFGSAQRLGVPLYYGGPHAAFIATKPDFLRFIPGRIVGKTKDVLGNDCYRLALQSREQHIKKERATSNICTAQALLANVSSLYTIYHGKKGIQEIGTQIFELTHSLRKRLNKLGFPIQNQYYFDTITVLDKDAETLYKELEDAGYLTFFDKKEPYLLTLSLDETVTQEDVNNIIEIFSRFEKTSRINELFDVIDTSLFRTSPILQDAIFDKISRDETKFMRYVSDLAKKDYSLVDGMIPLGSCTMKLNAAAQLEPLSWESVADCHPFAPLKYVAGYQQLIRDFSLDLKKITGFSHVSFQSNSGAMGEYSALLCIKKYHHGTRRNTILIPQSAHGTNFASASLAGFKIVKFDDSLFDDIEKFQTFVEERKDELAGMMITFPSTYGVFQRGIRHICYVIRRNGGIVYMDGANMNALAGLITPAEIGADVCHLNLHKTFCIPHGGGGPGMGPILCNDKLAPFLPTHCWQEPSIGNKSRSIGTISASQWSSASLLTIPYLYFRELGIFGIKKATLKAIENANWMKKRLEKYYDISEGEVAHEFLIDVSQLKSITEVDISKRLIDYSFHPPTMSWPKKSTLMIEPTETEDKEEMDRFIRAMISIRNEIDVCPALLKNAPHPINLIHEEWTMPYSMLQAFFPLPELKERKQWPTCARVDDLYGDKLMYQQLREKVR